MYSQRERMSHIDTFSILDGTLHTRMSWLLLNDQVSMWCTLHLPACCSFVDIPVQILWTWQFGAVSLPALDHNLIYGQHAPMYDARSALLRCTACILRQCPMCSCWVTTESSNRWHCGCLCMHVSSWHSDLSCRLPAASGSSIL